MFALPMCKRKKKTQIKVSPEKIVIPMVSWLILLEHLKFLCRPNQTYNRNRKTPTRRAEQATSAIRILLFKFW